MKQGWIKHFKDGETETGFEHELRAHTASWRHGRLDGLVAVDLHHGPVRVTLNAGEGNWWQSDTLVSKFRGYGKIGETSYLVRRVEYQIDEKDVGKFISRIVNGNHVGIKVSNELFQTTSEVGEAIKLTQAHVGKWLYVSLDCRSNMVTVTFHNKKK